MAQYSEHVALNAVDDDKSPSPIGDQVKQSLDRNKYNPHAVPPSIPFAINHGKAKKVYLHNAYKSAKACDCCLLPIEGHKVPIRAKLSKLYHLGSGFPLYFTFIKYSCILMLLMFGISGLYGIITNVIEGDCFDNNVDTSEATYYCVKGYILSFAIPNKRDNRELLNVQIVLNLFTVIFMMLFFHIIRYHFRVIKADVDKKVTSPPDYTIMIEGIPKEATKKQIKDWITDLGLRKGKKIKVERVVRSYNISDYINVGMEINNLNAKKVKLENLPAKKKPSNFQEKKEAFETEIAKKQQEQYSLKKTGKLPLCSFVFISFRKESHCRFIASLFKPKTIASRIFGAFLSGIGKSDEIFNDVKVSIVRAPEPTDVMWESLVSTPKSRAWRKTLSNIVTLILVALSFGLILLINWGQNKIIESRGEDSSIVQGLSIIGSLVIEGTNELMETAIEILTHHEQTVTYTRFLRGVAQKLTIAQFINTGLTNLLSEVILTDGSETETRLERINFYGRGGLLENMYWVFVTGAATCAIVTLFKPTYYLQKFFQSRAKSAAAKDPKSLKMTQREANELFEGPDFEMPKKFAGLMTTILVCSFFTPALPFSLIYVICGFVLHYWSDKYVLLRRAQLPREVGDHVATAMVELLEWSTAIFSAGNIIYYFTLKNSAGENAFTYEVLIWISLGLSLLHVFIPMESINKLLFTVDDEADEDDDEGVDENEYDPKEFKFVRYNFFTDYDLSNPVLRRGAITKLTKYIAHLMWLGDEGAEELERLKNTNMYRSLRLDKLEIQPREQSKIEEEEEEDDVNFEVLDKFIEDGEALTSEALQRFMADLNKRIPEIEDIPEYGEIITARPTEKGEDLGVSRARF